MNKTIGISNELIATPPNELKIYDPAICIDNDIMIHNATITICKM